MGWGASPLPSSILMEGKPVKVLGRPAKTDAHLRGFGASPMPSSIYVGSGEIGRRLGL